MAVWRAAAIERLPELRRLIEAAGSVMALWNELTMKFEHAYREPQDDHLIAAIYSYARWCFDAPRNADASHDPVSAVVVGFFEEIPTNRAAREDMPRWFTFQEVAQNKAVFGYYLSEDAFAELLAHMKRNAVQYVPRQSDGSLR